MLQVDGLSCRYGRVSAVNDVSLAVREGTIVAIVGSNGAGKTTLLRTLSGIHDAAAGCIVFAGSDITRLAAAKRVAVGLVQVPEGRQIFGALSVEENLKLGAYTRPANEISAGLEQVFVLFPVLAERRAGEAGALSGGEQQMLAIGRALMAQPRLLLLDEPSLGLAPMMVEFILEKIVELNRRGLSVVVVEQNASLALEIAHDAYVLETGRVVKSGEACALLRDPAVVEAYLGG
ncbi:ABC transporter ATP-binding protein [Bradyrhizobium sp. NAS80.1]|uniref:ABC transporter ATP-binding protein n=1 Tax=Bradyrhizobium sp. NAS80.1 TaxID=1680159 RepID=UPI001AEF526D|nr:ABC transporter ATP-binding protein [Bradyrhizobium sp. NAS80.1]